MTSVQPSLLTGKRRRSRPGGLWVLALLIGSLGLQPAWSGSKDDQVGFLESCQFIIYICKSC